MLFGLSNEGYVLGDFRKVSLGPPLALFLKMRVFRDLAKNAITWLFRPFSSRLLHYNLL